MTKRILSSGLAFLFLATLAVPTQAAEPTPYANLYEPQDSWVESMLEFRGRLQSFAADLQSESEQSGLSKVQLGEWHLLGWRAENTPQEKVFGLTTPVDQDIAKNELDMRKRYEQESRGTVEWRGRDRNHHGEDGIVSEMPGPNYCDHFLTYMARTLTVEQSVRVPIYLGSPAGIRVLLNGKEVFSKQGVRELEPNQDTVTLDLQEGVNTLVIRLCHQHGDSSNRKVYFSMHRRPGSVDIARSASQLQDTIYDDFPMQFDWMLQDTDGDLSAWLHQQGKAQLEEQMIRDTLGELAESTTAAAKGRELLARLENLVKAETGCNDASWLTLYEEAARARRQVRLASVRSQWPEIVFTKNHTIYPSFFAYTEGQSDAQAERHFRPGTSLCMLGWEDGEPVVRTLLEDEGGRMRDPDISYDAKRILFAWKKSDREDDYHLYEMEIASGDVRQLTDGLGFADFEGVYLPNGSLLFSSSRCVQTVDCWWTEVSNLYTCDADGKYLRRLGFDQVHTVSPKVTDNGTIIYTRWDYNDRGQVYPQGLFQMNPDGTAQTEYYGNNSWFPTTLTHARQIPGTKKLVAAAHGHHTPQVGELMIIDISKGRQEASGAQLIAPIRETKAVRVDGYGQEGDLFTYPYPLNEHEFVLGYNPFGRKDGRQRQFGIYYMRDDARRELLVYDPTISCAHPIPVVSRETPPLRPSVVDYRQKQGMFVLQDIYLGPGLKDIPRGTVKKLRVVELSFRAAGAGSNGNGGEAGGAMVSTPISISNGCWDVKTVLGDATVYEDGSACFKVPARTPVYFQALDEKDHVVQTMRSWSTLQPGETFACVGCHEDKNGTSTQPGRATQALRAGPETLAPFYGAPRGFSFVKEVQPIIDRHCVECHDGEKLNEKSGKPIFSLTAKQTAGHGGRLWSDAYVALTGATRENYNGQSDREVVNWVSPQSAPTMQLPYKRGAATSKLMTMLEKEHGKKKLSKEELDKIACWIDLGVPYCGDYVEANAWSEGDVQKYQRYQTKRDRMEAVEQDNIKALLEKFGSSTP